MKRRSLRALTSRSPLVFFLGVGLGAACGDNFSAPLAAPLHVLECANPMPCGTFSAPPEYGQTQSEYADAQRCVFESLAAGDPITIAYSDGCEGQCYGSAFFVRSDDSVIRQDYQGSFPGEPGVEFAGLLVEFDDWSESQSCTLVGRQYFADCLVAYDESCLSKSAWVSDCSTPSPQNCN